MIHNMRLILLVLFYFMTSISSAGAHHPEAMVAEALPLDKRTVGGHCTDPNKSGDLVFGICLPTNERYHGAEYVSGWCPFDANNVKCCFRHRCHPTIQKSECMFVSYCQKLHGKTTDSSYRDVEIISEANETPRSMHRRRRLQVLL
jgi:hypothetical protein